MKSCTVFCAGDFDLPIQSMDGELIIDHTDKEPLGAAILTLAGYNSAMSLDNVTFSESGKLTMTDKLPLKNGEKLTLVDYPSAGQVPGHKVSAWLKIKA